MEYPELIDTDRYRSERKAGEAIGHHPEYTVIMENMAFCRCTCGWESQHYFDGFQFAHGDWVSHIILHGAKIDYST